MGFHLRGEKVDFGTTSIENIFINDFMPMANGTFVKVYLLGFKFAQEASSGIDKDNISISKHLNIPMEDVVSSWDFWEKKNIIIKHAKNDASGDYDIEFLSLRELYLENNYALKEATTDSNRPTSSDLIDSTKNKEVREMFYNIDQIMRRQLTTNERTEILGWIFEFNHSPELIVKAFLYAVEQKNVKNVNYVGAIIRSWYDQGILTVEQAEDFMKSSGKAYTAYRRIYRVLGYANKAVSGGDREIIDRWIDRDQLDLDFICEVIKEASKRTSNINMNYMDTVVRNLIEEKVDSLEKYNDYLNVKASAKLAEPQTSSRSKESAKSTHRNRFHEFEPKTNDYKPEDLEKLLRSKK